MKGEREKLPVVITGGAGAIGSEVTRGLALAGHPTFVFLTRENRNGITPEQRFADRVRNPIRAIGGVEPIPVYADLTKEDELKEGLDLVDSILDSGQPVHYFALAATGLRGVRTSMGKIFVGLQKTMRSRPLSIEDLEDATNRIRQVVSTERGMQPAMQTNKDAAISVFDALLKKGHLSSDSSAVNLSSSPTDDLMQGLKVNAFYDAVAQGKSGGEVELEARCRALGIKYLKIIAPVIDRTEVGEMSGELEKIVQAAGVETKVPKASIGQTVVALLAEFDYQQKGRTDRIRTIYMAEDGLTYLKRPANWPVPLLPYL